MDVASEITAGPANLALGRGGLLIRNVPAGQCTYACTYCCAGDGQVRIRRRPFHPTEQVVSAVRGRVERTPAMKSRIRSLVFHTCGEPTLDSHIGVELRYLAALRLPMTVLTNASLLWRPEVRAELALAQRVVIKLDTVDDDLWRRLNRPARQLRLARVLEGISQFRSRFTGELHTRTTIVPGCNDSAARLRSLAAFLEELQPATAWLAVPEPTSSGAPGAGAAALRAARRRLHRSAPVLEIARCPARRT